MASFQGKVIAITGSASGIGLATAKILAHRGAKLALSDNQLESLEKAVATIQADGGEVVGTVVDVSSSSAVNDWISSTVKRFGRLDGAVNMAGTMTHQQGIFCNLVDMKDETWDFVMGVNLTGMMYCLRAELRVMEKGAAIVNATSMAGMMGRPGIIAYSTSKHGVIGMTRTAAKEVGSKGIRVNAIAPGPIETPMLSKIVEAAGSSQEAVTNTYKNVPLQRRGTAEECAQTVVYLLSDESSFTTGAVYPVDGGATA